MYTKTSSLPPVALIAGPTASGKSALALRIAATTGGVIVNADSAQVYSDLRIVSARPSIEEEAQAPHRLFGRVDGERAYSAPEWAAAARAEIDAIHADGKLPILVGGSGLYLKTLLDGIAPVPDIDPAIRATVRGLDVADAHAALVREDIEAATRLRETDTTRVARALEVVRSTGGTLARWQAERRGGIAERIALAPTVLLPRRDWLYERCDARFAAILASGGIGEVEALLARRLDPALPVMRAIGVREIAEGLVGIRSWEEVATLGAQQTRRYAKRQYTWLAHQCPKDWPRIGDLAAFDAIILRILALTA